MLVRKFGWRGPVSGLVLGIGLIAFDGRAAAQVAYECDRVCNVCHPDKYADYKKHGHPWQEIPTGGQAPGPDLFGFASVGVGVPNLPTGMTWADVVAILGNFKEGHGYFIRASDGKRVDPTTGTASSYPAQCFECHNPTGYQPAGIM